MIKYSILLLLILKCILISQISPLSNYTQEIPSTTISWISDDLSGVAFNTSTNNLFMIEDDDGVIWETDINIEYLRTVIGGEFGDVEDIEYLNNHEFAIVTEEGRLYIGLIGNDDNSIDPDIFQEIIFDTHDENNGAEGVAFDSLNQLYFVVKEKDPMAFYIFQKPAHNNDTTMTPDIPFNAETEFSGIVSDLSSIAFDYRTNRVLILSDESQKLIDVNPWSGEIYGILNLDDMEQPEGVCFINDNFDLLIVGEPNAYTIYSNILGINSEYSFVNFSIKQNYPNPFNPVTTLQYNLIEDSFVKITIYDIYGNLIKNLVNEKQTSGNKLIQWNATNNQGGQVSSGLYLYEISSGDFRKSRSMVLLK